MRTDKRLAKGTLTDSNATLYTTPSGAKTIVKSLAVCNTSGAAATLTIKLAGKAIYAAYSLAANASLIISALDQILETGELIEGLAGTTGVLDFIISGIEVT